ncbi:MAG: flippase, partial [Calditrichaeota bacterium]
YVSHLGILSVVVTLLIVAGLYTIAPSFGYSPETTQGLYIIGLALIPTAVMVILDATLVTHERVELITYSQIIENIGNISGTIYLLLNGYGIIAIFINFTVFRYITLIIKGMFFVKYIVRPRWEFDFTFLKSLIKDLKIFTMLGILGGLSSQTEVIVLSLFQADAEVGHYTAALKLITVWYIIPQSVMSIVFPLLSKSFGQAKEKFQDIQHKAVKYLMAVAIPLAAGILMLGDQLITWFYGAGFAQSIRSLQILAWMPILIFLSGILWRTLLATNKQKTALQANIICSSVRVFSAILFIYWLGYDGAAVALTSGYGFYVLLHFYFIWRIGYRIPFFQITWRFFAAAALMGVFSYLFTHTLGLHFFINIFLSIIIYFAAVLLFKGFNKDDFALIRQIIHTRREATT